MQYIKILDATQILLDTSSKTTHHPSTHTHTHTHPHAHTHSHSHSLARTHTERLSVAIYMPERRWMCGLWVWFYTPCCAAPSPSMTPAYRTCSRKLKQVGGVAFVCFSVCWVEWERVTVKRDLFSWSLFSNFIHLFDPCFVSKKLDIRRIRSSFYTFSCWLIYAYCRCSSPFRLPFFFPPYRSPISYLLPSSYLLASAYLLPSSNLFPYPYLFLSSFLLPPSFLHSIPAPLDTLNLCNVHYSGMYNLPSHLSPSARDLILRLLVVDPMKRITIKGKSCM